MSFLGLGHVRHYTDAEWPAVKAALQNAGIDAGTGALFTATQHAIAELLQQDQLVQLAKQAIADATDPSLDAAQKLSKAVGDVIPGLITWFATGGVKKEAGELTTLATTFVQEVFSNSVSTSMKQAIADVETVVKKLP